MNQNQRLVILVACTLVLIALIFPPFILDLPNGATINAGYAFIFTPPTRGYLTARVNVGTMLMEWIAILLLAFGSWMYVKQPGGQALFKTINLSALANSISTGGTSHGNSQPRVIRGGFVHRVLALIIDYVIITLSVYVLFFILGMLGFSDSEQAEQMARAAFFIAFLLYFSLQESSHFQATIGKRALKIKVVRLDGVAPTFWQSIGRNASKTLSGLFFGIGYLMCVFTKRKQCLHDMLASCLVVKADATVQEVNSAMSKVK